MAWDLDTVVGAAWAAAGRRTDTALNAAIAISSSAMRRIRRRLQSLRCVVGITCMVASVEHQTQVHLMIFVRCPFDLGTPYVQE